MYLGYLVDVPDEKGKITFRQKGNAKYAMNTIAPMIQNASIRS